MAKVFNMTFTSSLTDICEINSSFDKGVLKVCYTGDNNNKSNISRKAIESSIKTIYNCPVVAHYKREEGDFGGHDMEIVRDADGSLRLVNLTEPLGVIPESAQSWFDVMEDENGEEHEYFFTEVLLWKRQESYRKVKKDGIVAHSMEITIRDGEMIDGIYHIYDFEFTAFALIGERPCFEGSALELFSAADFKQQMSEMMAELKETFTQIDTSKEDGDKFTKTNSKEGGEKTLDKKLELLEKYGIDVDTLDFSIEDLSIEELTEKFEAMKAAEKESEGDKIEGNNANYSLTSNLVEEINLELQKVTMTREWGECQQYRYVDCDIDLGEVYCWDTQDWLLYGFTYSMEGDNVIIDYESKKRKKYAIVDFDEIEQPSPFASTFTEMENAISESASAKAEIESKFNTSCETISSLESEITELRQFKQDIEDTKAHEERDEVFAMFTELTGIDSFEELKNDCMKYSIDELEDKCYAIRGRNMANLKFSLDEGTPKIKIAQKIKEEKECEDLPYGGIVERYGCAGKGTN